MNLAAVSKGESAVVTAVINPLDDNRHEGAGRGKVITLSFPEMASNVRPGGDVFVTVPTVVASDIATRWTFCAI